MTFFTILAGSCRGTAIFRELRALPLWRALLHLVLMCILTGLIAAVGEGLWLNRRIECAAVAAGGEFGTLTVSSRGLRIARDPERARLLRVNEKFALVYLPAGSGAAKQPDRKQSAGAPALSAPVIREGMNYPSTFYFGPELAVFAVRESDSQYLLSVPSGSWLDMFRVNAGKFGDSLAGIARASSGRAPGEELTVNPAAMKSQLCAAADAALFLIQFFQALFQALMFVGIFTLMFALTSRRRTLKVRELAVLGIYAGFPAMLVGALVPALALPFLSYHFVYLFGMTGFLLFIINRLEREAAEKTSRPGADGEDFP